MHMEQEESKTVGDGNEKAKEAKEASGRYYSVCPGEEGTSRQPLQRQEEKA